MTPNWVRAHAECTRDAVFDALYKRVQKDVAEANTRCLAGEGSRFVVQAEVDSNAAAAFSVKRCTGRDCDASILFQRFELEIRVTRTNNGAFSVRPTWNSCDLSCDLYVEDVPHKLWEISQVSLEPLFFGT